MLAKDSLKRVICWRRFGWNSVELFYLNKINKVKMLVK